MHKAGFFSLALAGAALASFAAAQQGGSAVQPGSSAAVPVPTRQSGTPAQADAPPGRAQQAATPPSAQPGAPQATQPSAATGATTDPTAPTTPATADEKRVKGELVSKIDAKTAKQGDSVVVKTKETVKTSDGTEIPKGSKLIGRVTAVRPQNESSQNSAVALVFDQAQLKNGQTMPIRSTLEDVGTPQIAEAAPDTMAIAPSPSAGAPAGSGPMSGGPGTASRPPASVSGGASATTAPTHSAGGPTATASGSVAGRVVSGSGPNAIKTTDIPGVYMTSNGTAKESGAIYAAKSNLHLNSGTEIVLNIAPAAASSGGGTQ